MYEYSTSHSVDDQTHSEGGGEPYKGRETCVGKACTPREGHRPKIGGGREASELLPKKYDDSARVITATDLFEDQGERGEDVCSDQGNLRHNCEGRFRGVLAR